MSKEAEQDLFWLMTQLSEGAEQQSVEEVMRRIDAIIDEDLSQHAQPQRVRDAYRKLVELYRHRDPEPKAPLSVQARRRNRRHKKSSSSCSMDASTLRESDVDLLRSDVALLRRVKHRHLLNVESFSLFKSRFTVGLDVQSDCYVVLQELLEDYGALNGCEIACMLAQASSGLVFLLDSVANFIKLSQLHIASCLRPENIVLCSDGLLKLSGFHPAVQPIRSCQRGSECDLAALGHQEDSNNERGGLLLQRMAMLLYQLDHDTHQQLRSLRHCLPADRQRLDDRYNRLFSLCADWPADKPADFRRILFSDFVNHHTVELSDFQKPLELVYTAVM